jgi:hypothetical protein
MTSRIPAAELDRLRARRPGFVVAADDPGWDAARHAFNLMVDQRPELVAFPSSADDIVEILRVARAHGLRVAPQRTGHAAEPIESLAGAILLRTDLMEGATVDVEARTARVNAGATWAEVVEQASPHGLAALAGSSLGIGVVGYHLGGGLSFLSRKHGLAANSVTAIELVATDGRKLRVDADHEPELFWALRGGSGSFGVVTAMELDLYPAPEIYAGNAFFAFERSREVLHAWRDLTHTAPEELTLTARLLRVPDVPGPPEELRGRSFALIGAVYLGDEAVGAELLAPVRELGPQIDTIAMVEPAALGGVHMDPEAPVASRDDHMLLHDLPPEAIDAFVTVAGPGSGSSLLSVELRQNGGALAREQPGAGALASLPGEHVLFGAGSIEEPGDADRIAADLDRITAALAPYEAGRYLNFSDDPLDGAAFFDAPTYRRLQAIRAEWDLDRLLLASHPVI